MFLWTFAAADFAFGAIVMGVIRDVAVTWFSVLDQSAPLGATLLVFRDTTTPERPRKRVAAAKADESLMLLSVLSM